tara:strand:+ start:44 stop:1822 length:1779 start_codon:yes stop_codon:yes gene_type:complete
MNLFEKIKKRKQRDNSYLFDDGDELNKIKKPSKQANKDVFDVTGKSAVRDAKKYASGEYPKIGGGNRGTPKSKGSGAYTGGIGPELPNEKDFMRRNVAKSGLKIKGDTPIRINVDPKAAKTPTARQTADAKKTNEFVQGIFQRRIKKIKGTKTGKPISTGDIGFTAPDRKTKVAKRTTRAIKQGYPDPFDIDTSKASKEVAKDLKVPKKSDFKKLDKKPGGYRAPASEFGKGVTPGEFRSKQLSASAFRKTQPKDVKLPKSFRDITKEIKNLKKSNKDISKILSATPRTVTKKYKPTTTVKQSEVSKQAKDFTTKVNQARTKKVTPTTTASEPKKPSVFKRVRAATSGKKVTNSKGIGNKFRGQENIAARNAEIIKRGGSVTGGGGKPPKPPRNVTFSAADFPDDNTGKIVKTGGTKTSRVVTKQTKALMSGQQKFAKSVVGKGIKKNLPTVYKGLKALKPAGRAFAKTGVIGGLATIGLAASPAVRGFIKKAAAGGIAGGILGGAAASQKQSDKERIKQMKKPVFKDEILDKKGKQKFPDSKKVVTTGLNLSDISKPKKKDKSRTAQSIKTETDYLKQRQKVAPYGAKYSG